MDNLQTELFTPETVRNSSAEPAAQIKKHEHHCSGYELRLTATFHFEPQAKTSSGYDYYLTCTKCRQIVGEMFVPHELEAHKMKEINRFIDLIERH